MKRIVSILVLVALALNSAKATDRPIIGVLAQELKGTNKSYIAASYVKMIESSGARVVPIFIGRSYNYYNEICGYLNGVVLPGGSVDVYGTNGYGQAARYIHGIALALNAKKDHFPILGICQGLEALAVISSGMAPNILSNVTGMFNIGLPLKFESGYRTSSLYGSASNDVIQILKTKPVTANYHKFGVNPTTIAELPWRVLSVNLDTKGNTFVSSMEHIWSPIVGVQFHPEKNQFEWNPMQNNPHTRDAIIASRHFYDWLVTESRRSNHSFPTIEVENNHLIYNFARNYTGKSGGFNEEVYFFSYHGPNIF